MSKIALICNQVNCNLMLKKIILSSFKKQNITKIESDLYNHHASKLYLQINRDDSIVQN